MTGPPGVPLWVRSALFTVLVPGSVAGLLPYVLATGRYRLPVDIGPARWLGILPLALGVAIYVATTWQFGAVGRGTPAPWDAPRDLVRTGLHAWVRNPMYLGVLLCILGEALLFEAAILLLYLVVVGLAFHVRVLVYEEPALRRAFGPAFEIYTHRVRRWVPRRPSAATRRSAESNAAGGQ